MNNLYETLGVSHKATFAEIEHVYKLQLKHFDPSFGVSMDDITLAYKTLSKPDTREEYDRYISQDQYIQHMNEGYEEDPEV